MRITTNANFHVTMVSLLFGQTQPGHRSRGCVHLFILHYCVWICKLTYSRTLKRGDAFDGFPHALVRLNSGMCDGFPCHAHDARQAKSNTYSPQWTMPRPHNDWVRDSRIDTMDRIYRIRGLTLTNASSSCLILLILKILLPMPHYQSFGGLPLGDVLQESPVTCYPNTTSADGTHTRTVRGGMPIRQVCK